jgi:double-stranded uracil-DNA glycosylase
MGLGLTDIAKHVSGMDRELPQGALGREACAALKAKITAAEPEWLAFTSLTAGRRYLGRAAGFGEQPERIGRTRLWLLPSPSPTAGWNWSSNTHWWRMLADEASLPSSWREPKGAPRGSVIGRSLSKSAQLNANKRQ